MILKVKVGERFFEVQVEDLRARPIRAIIDDEVFEVWPESKAAYTVGGSVRAPTNDNLRNTAQAASPTPIVTPTHSGGDAKSGKSVRAPIPGVITAILVHPGDDVTVGQELCKLEAMKMNNSIRSNRAGKIEAINVSVGQQVKHNDSLMEFAE